MIGGTSFYNTLFKKYVTIFGTLFNNIKIERRDENGNLEQNFKVPIAYGPREKFLARITDNPDAIALTSIKLPRMAFAISAIQYAPERKLQTINKIVSRKNVNGTNVYDKVFNPVPYDVGFKLQILSKTMEDGLRIIEQILPYFTPEWTVSAKLLGNDFDNVTDIPLILNDVQIEDSYENDFLARKVLTFTLNFTMKCYFYGPVTSSKIIKFATVKIFPDLTANTELTTTSVRPGLTIDGEPTSNADLSVALSQIEEDDNYGFIVTIEDN
jgi:T4-like virus Myoviridae tail sheath stabiliser